LDLRRNGDDADLLIVESIVASSISSCASLFLAFLRRVIVHFLFRLPRLRTGLGKGSDTGMIKGHVAFKPLVDLNNAVSRSLVSRSGKSSTFLSLRMESKSKVFTMVMFFRDDSWSRPNCMAHSIDQTLAIFCGFDDLLLYRSGFPCF